MLENKKINGVHATRFIASWIKSGGDLYSCEGFEGFTNWLKSLGLSEEDIHDVHEIATMGKLELEYLAKQFLKNNKTLLKEEA